MKEFFLAILVFALLGGGMYGWSFYRHHAVETSDPRPSINELPTLSAENPSLASSQSEGMDATSDDTESSDTPTAHPDDPETLTVSVLNGGSTGGSAGKMTTYLQSKGYKKAKAGNTDGSNVGIVIYYADDMEDEAKALQLMLLDNYKGVTASPAKDAKNKDATSAPLVVVLGA